MPRVLLALLAVTLTACLEREETIVVARDGSVRVTHTIRGDAGDLDGGAAALPTAPTWRVERTTRAKADGEPEHILTAKAGFDRLADMPTSFAPEGAAGALRWATTLRTRETDAGTEYLLRRVYQPLRWGPFAFIRRRYVDDAAEQQISRWKELDREARVALLTRLLDGERAKTEQLGVDAATRLGVTGDDLAVARLALRDALAGHFAREITPAAVLELLALPQAQLGQRAAALQRGLDDVSAAALTSALPGRARAAVDAALAAARRALEVVEDLDDEAFVVRLTLPGQPAGDNAEERAATDAGARFVWRFDGKAMRDRQHVLVARSVVPRGQ